MNRSGRAAAAGLGIVERLRIGSRLAAFALALAIALPAHFLSRLFTRDRPVPPVFLAVCARIVGARVRTHGEPLRRDVFFIANHVSWIDILALAGASGTAFVAMAELAETPLVGFLCRLNRTVFVSREDRLGVAGQIDAVREALGDDWRIAVFPEGTTSAELLPFKTSILSVLDPPPPRVRVQPVVIDYGADTAELAWVGDEPGLENVKRILARRGTFALDLHFLDPFDPAEAGGRKAIGARAREAMERAIAETSNLAARPSPAPSTNL